jgi:hypothetical protein
LSKPDGSVSDFRAEGVVVQMSGLTLLLHVVETGATGMQRAGIGPTVVQGMDQNLANQ